MSPAKLFKAVMEISDRIQTKHNEPFLKDGKTQGSKSDSGPSKADIAAAFIEELRRSRNKSKTHTLNNLIVQKRQTTSEDKKQ